MPRRCTKCGGSSEFYYIKKRQAFTSWCKDCYRKRGREYQHNYYHKSRPGHRIASLNRARRNREFIDEIKRVPCMDCGLTFMPCVMDFDHRDGSEKSYAVAMMVRHSHAKILSEVAKCDIVCSNCHRIRTWKRRHGIAIDDRTISEE